MAKYFVSKRRRGLRKRTDARGGVQADLEQAGEDEDEDLPQEAASRLRAANGAENLGAMNIEMVVLGEELVGALLPLPQHTASSGSPAEPAILQVPQPEPISSNSTQSSVLQSSSSVFDNISLI